MNHSQPTLVKLALTASIYFIDKIIYLRHLKPKENWKFWLVPGNDVLPNVWWPIQRTLLEAQTISSFQLNLGEKKSFKRLKSISPIPLRCKSAIFFFFWLSLHFLNHEYDFLCCSSLMTLSPHALEFWETWEAFLLTMLFFFVSFFFF